MLHTKESHVIQEYLSLLLNEHGKLFESMHLTSVEAKLDQIFTTMDSYAALLDSCRHTFNIIGPNERISDHIIDSLSPLALLLRLSSERLSQKMREGLDSTLRFADLGSGAGLPGIPLAIAFNALFKESNIAMRFFLVERKEKKSNFLLSCKSELSKNFETLDIQIVKKNLSEWIPREEIDIIFFRAFRPISDITTELKNIGAQSDIIAYKGKMQTIEEEFAPYKDSTLQILGIHRLEHFNEKERHAVHIRMI